MRGRNRHAWGLVLRLASVLMWDYPAPSPPDLAGFLIFVRAQEGTFDFDRPMALVNVMSDGVGLQVPCASFPLSGPGPWVAVVQALGVAGEVSEVSNEVGFFWSRQGGCQVTAPVTPGGPVVPPKPRPGQLPGPRLGELFPPVVPSMPPQATKPRGGGGLETLTESCAWRGCQAPSRPPRVDPGPPLTEQPAWRGQRRK